MTLGKTIKTLRERNDLGVRELARLVSVAPSHITRIEADQARPSTELAGRLAFAMGAPAQALQYLAGEWGASELAGNTERLRRLIPSWTSEDEAELQAAEKGPPASDAAVALCDRLATALATEVSADDFVPEFYGDDVLSLLHLAQRSTPERLALLVHHAADQAALSELDRRESKLTAGSMDSLRIQLSQLADTGGTAGQNAPADAS